MAASSKLEASAYILCWMFFSISTILFNKWLIDTAEFRYPIILTTWHLLFASVATQLLAHTTSLLDSRHDIPLTGRLFTRTLLPIAILFSGSLIFSNIVYMYLSVAFIQMLKSAGPVAVLLVSWLFGVASPNMQAFANIALIVCGVALASFGDIGFSWMGFFIQWAGTICEAVRLVMTQVMLSGEGYKMDPLVSLYYFAPVCTVVNILMAVVFEGSKFKWEDVERVGMGILILNAFVAFFLNVASVFLIGKTSGLVMSLSGILKNILLVSFSVVIWGTQISLLQFVGYSIALVGLVSYSIGLAVLREKASEALYYATEAWEESGLGDNKCVAILTNNSPVLAFVLVTAVISGSLRCFPELTGDEAIARIEKSVGDYGLMLDLH